MTRAPFEKSVFVNCPFDTDYRQLLHALLFTIKYFGLTPRICLEEANAGEVRIDKILRLIRASRFGIHDLSRIQAVHAGELYRMNMPFELGIDYGCQRLKGGKFSTKRLLVLERDNYRYQAALSDFAGSDIQSHQNEPMEMIRVVRDWLVTEGVRRAPGLRKIWFDFNDFTADLQLRSSADGHDPADIERIPIPEVIAYMDDWLQRHSAAKGRTLDIAERNLRRPRGFA